MRLPEETREKIREVFSRYLDSSNTKVLLFGSYASGKAGSSSDIDLCVKGSSPLALEVWAKMDEDFRDSMIPKKVDLVDYHRVVQEFRVIIDRDGVPFWP